jgi:hypothetical protein
MNSLSQLFRNMTTRSSRNVTEDDEDPEHDDEWNFLYEFQRNYRKREKITGRILLKELEVSPSMLQYLYSKSIFPSSKANSKGLKLRMKLREFYENPSAFSHVVDRDPHHSMELFCEANRDTFDENGIDSVIFDSLNNKIIICGNEANKDTATKIVRDLYLQYSAEDDISLDFEGTSFLCLPVVSTFHPPRQY